MVYCSACGTRHDDAAARFCSQCGAALRGDAPSTPARPAKPTNLAYDTNLQQVLLLVGAILGWVFAAFLAIGFLWLLDGPRWMGPHFMGSDWFPEARGTLSLVFLLMLAAAIVVPFFALHARTLVARGRMEDAGVIATVAGIIMCFTNGILPGVLVLVGGVLAWMTGRQAGAGAAQTPPQP